MKKALLWAISTLLFSTNLSYASDARVDSMGGLTLVATDETDDINPFTLGNPAGLALLAPQTRLDLAGQWIKESDPSNQFHIYGSMNELNDDTVKYHGLIAFLNPNWAIQADGDTLHNEGEDNGSSNNLDTNDRTRGLFRSAYNFGPFVLGGAIQPTQSNLVFNPHQFDFNDEITSGSGTVNNLSGTFGLLTNFPDNTDMKQNHLRIGGIVGVQLSPAQEIDTLQVFNTGTSSNFTITQTISDNNVLTWGPEIYFQSSNSFELALLGRFSSFNVSFQQDSTDPTSIGNVSSYNVETGNTYIGIAVLKMTNPISGSMNFKSGILITAEGADTSVFSPGGTANGGTSITAWTAQAGIGFDHPHDYTIGVQTNLEQITGNESNSGGVTSTNNFFVYKISVGGEHWLSKNWALRFGVVYDNANNRGTADQSEFLIPVAPGEEVTTSTIDVGIGYEDPSLKLDLNLLEGQPVVDNDPSIYANQYGAQLAASLLL